MNELIVVRGGGDIATGTIHRLVKCGYKVIVTEVENPSAIRRKVAFCEAVFDGEVFVDGVGCKKISSLEQAKEVFSENKAALIIDPQCKMIDEIKPDILIDGILAKKNLGTTKDMANMTIALGPGFCAGKDVDYVVETKRSHKLGSIIEQGYAIENTGIPGIIAGYGKERVIHSPATGIIKNINDISDIVKKGDIIAYVEETPVYATLDGVLRGMIRNGYYCNKGLKIADIDPRISEQENCFSISDKARCIAGSVLELVVRYGKNKCR